MILPVLELAFIFERVMLSQHSISVCYVIAEIAFVLHATGEVLCSETISHIHIPFNTSLVHVTLFTDNSRLAHEFPLLPITLSYFVLEYYGTTAVFLVIQLLPRIHLRFCNKHNILAPVTLIFRLRVFESSL